MCIRDRVGRSRPLADEVGQGLTETFEGGLAVQQFFSASLIPDATPEQRAAMNEQQRLSCDGQRAAAIFRARSQLDVRPLLPRVRCPTLVMHCEGDAMVKVELGRDLAAAVAGARFEALHSRNHVPLHG